MFSVVAFSAVKRCSRQSAVWHILGPKLHIFKILKLASRTANSGASPKMVGQSVSRPEACYGPDAVALYVLVLHNNTVSLIACVIEKKALLQTVRIRAFYAIWEQKTDFSSNRRMGSCIEYNTWLFLTLGGYFTLVLKRARVLLQKLRKT